MPSFNCYLVAIDSPSLGNKINSIAYSLDLTTSFTPRILKEPRPGILIEKVTKLKGLTSNSETIGRSTLSTAATIHTRTLPHNAILTSILKSALCNSILSECSTRKYLNRHQKNTSFYRICNVLHNPVGFQLGFQLCFRQHSFEFHLSSKAPNPPPLCRLHIKASSQNTYFKGTCYLTL